MQEQANPTLGSEELGRAILEELRAIRKLLEREGRPAERDPETPRAPRSATPREVDPAALAGVRVEAEAWRQQFAEAQGRKLTQAAAWSSTAAWEAKRAARRAQKEQA